MQRTVTAANMVVSSQAYGLILTSKHLQQMLLPQGLITSPYEILDYNATLILHDKQGARATFQRRQKVRFLQEGVSGILDHAWGEGILLTNYQHSAGALEDSFKDQGRRHLVVGFERPMNRGETLSFQVNREAMEAFTQRDEWLETTIDHPIRRLTQQVIFPKNRPVRAALLRRGNRDHTVPVQRLPDGRTLIAFRLADPQSDLPYMLRWSW